MPTNKIVHAAQRAAFGAAIDATIHAVRGKGTEKMTRAEYRKAAVDAVRQLSKDVGIPQDLKAIVKDEDVDFLAQSAMDDACRPGNPKDPTLEDIKALYRSLM